MKVTQLCIALSSFPFRLPLSSHAYRTLRNSFFLLFAFSSSLVAVPLTNTNFQTAVNLWFSDEANATATYGHIKDWTLRR